MSDSKPARDYQQLFWLSFSILFLELALIRYIPSYFRMLSFFSNFLLLSCFFGMSLGMLHQRGRRLFPLSLALTALTVGYVTIERPGANINFKSADVIFFGSEFLSEAQRSLPFMLVLLVVFVVFGLIFYGLGQELMDRLRRLPSLPGYSVNLWGSLVGSLCFTLMSVQGVHPAVWFLVAVLGLLPCWPASTGGRLGFVASALLLIGFAAQDVSSQWSPYSRVELRRQDSQTANIYVNGVSHQTMFPADQETGYAIAYRGYMSQGAQPPEVAILGAGSGNDVSAALACGVKHIEAVEIDPVINKLGITYHPRRPFQDPRVTVHIMDGRRFLRSFQGKLDIVSFGLVDSLTLLSGFSSARLENNLFTENSFRDAKALIRPDGIVVVYNDFRECWLVARYYHQMVNLFGRDKVLLITLPARPHMSVKDGGMTASAMIIAGNIEPVRKWLQARPGGSIETQFDDTWQQVIPATDDWPFPYLRQAEIPSHNLWSGLLLLALSGATLGLVLRSEMGQIHWKMFWLGAGFMLIETRGIGRMSLLFGTSWQGSSLSILSILALALLANWVAQRHDLDRLRPLILGGLLCCLLLDAVIPTNAALDLPIPQRLMASVVILFSPMFFSGLLFSQALRSQKNAAGAIGSNLLGAMLGGTLENFTTVIGMKGLLGIAALIYLTAYRSN